MILLSLSNSKSPPFVVSPILNFVGLVQYVTICLKLSPKNCCVRSFFQNLIIATHVWRSGLSIFSLNSKKVQNNAARLIFRITRSAPVTPMLHFLHWLPTEQRIEYKLTLLFLIRLPSTFQNFFTFTLLPGSSALLQTPECSEYHPSEQNPVVSALSLTRLQLSGTNSLFLSAILPLSALFNLP